MGKPTIEELNVLKAEKDRVELAFELGICPECGEKTKDDGDYVIYQICSKVKEHPSKLLYINDDDDY